MPITEETLSAEDILALREDSEVEFKKAAGRDGSGELPNDFWPTYSAFANTEGGKIFLGVARETRQDTRLVGLGDPDKMQKSIFDLLNNKQKVSANVLDNHAVLVHNIRGKNILEITVPRAPRRLPSVYVGANPFDGTYVRRHEGDYRRMMLIFVACWPNRLMVLAMIVF